MLTAPRAPLLAPSRGCPHPHGTGVGPGSTCPGGRGTQRSGGRVCPVSASGQWSSGRAGTSLVREVTPAGRAWASARGGTPTRPAACGLRPGARGAGNPSRDPRPPSGRTWRGPSARGGGAEAKVQTLPFPQGSPDSAQNLRQLRAARCSGSGRGERGAAAGHRAPRATFLKLRASGLPAPCRRSLQCWLNINLCRPPGWGRLRNLGTLESSGKPASCPLGGPQAEPHAPALPSENP